MTIALGVIMISVPFSISSRRVQGSQWLGPVGDLDLATCPVLERAFEEARSGDAQTIVVDLGEVTFMDSTGLRLLLDMAEATRSVCRSPA